MAEDPNAGSNISSQAETVQRSVSPPEPLLAHLQLVLGDRYRVEHEVGRGGMGIVYLAQDLRHQRRVALKVVSPEVSHGLGGERFLREIRIAASLAHPNILPLYDSGEAGGLLFYVMPFVQGESLRDRLYREKQLPLRDALQITREIAEALQYAHGKGFIHRDIKPANILLHEGHAMLTDFGVARAIGEARADQLTQTGLAVGSPVYMSPEQATGEEGLDPRSDLYSLGCVVYEMLSGDPPFTGSTPRAILARKVAEPVPRLRVVREALPAGVEQIVSKALARVPADRFSSAAELIEALGQPLETTAPRTPVVRHAVPIGLLALVLIAAGWWGWNHRLGAGASSVESLAVLPFSNLSGPDQEFFAAGMQDTLIGELSRIQALRVISRTSTIRYRNTDQSLPEIARELRVNRIVEGSVLRDGQNLRFQVQLVQPFPQERQLWGQTYDRHLRDVLSLNREVAAAIAGEIRVKLTPQDQTRLASSRPINPEAHEAYLRGLFHIQQQTPEDFKRGLDYLHEAVAKDPTDPLAWAGLASGYSIMGHGPNATPESLPRAKAAALKALELDSTLPAPYAVLAQIKAYKEWDYAGAERDFLRALELNPALAEAHRHFGWQLVLFDRTDEAFSHMVSARESDPLAPIYSAELAWAYWWKKDPEPEKALEEANKALELNPKFPMALYVLGGIYLDQGRNADAIRTHEMLASISPAWRWALAYTYAKTGRRDEARRLADELAKNPREIYGWGLPAVYWELGEKDQAFRWLEYGVGKRFNWMPWMGWNRHLAPLRGDPRFGKLLQRMNLSS